MHPLLFRIGTFDITSFGAMMAVALVIGLWILQNEATRGGLPDGVKDAGLVGVVGGMIGAKVFWTVEHASIAPVTELLFSRGGLSWYGGLIGGVGSGLLFIRARRWPLMPILAAATPALAVGQLFGRIGCFLVGDDYGWPTSLPWGVAFPEGLPPTTVRVHPTQLYEALGLAIIAAVLFYWRRAAVDDRQVLGRYLVMVAALRFGIEFVRVHDPIAFGLAPAHWISLLVASIGIGLLVQRSDSTEMMGTGQ
jgi:phosphatidylglycerol:prolipoprotein diacylglycerol transferase